MMENPQLAPALYLLPSALSSADIDAVLPAGNIEIMRSLRHYTVENLREARRFLKRCDRSIDIDSLSFHELNSHTDLSEIAQWLAPLEHGEAIGLMSDAGCPGVADPGAAIVGIAHAKGLRVVPLVGPSSILMGLMASGFNGQGFAFHGYLPVDASARAARIKQLEAASRRDDMTQIFIETPYRNNAMLRALCENLAPDTRICVAESITDPETESIIEMTANKWCKRLDATDLHKRPAIFLIYAGRPLDAPKKTPRHGNTRRQ